jgi:ribosome-binding protein aMBF1 (putative translation factor)
MIANERQHRISKATIKRFESAIASAEADGPREGVHPRLHTAMVDGLRSQRDELRREVRAYGALRDGKVKRRVLHSIGDIPSVLIEGRIASRLTQRELAQRISVPEQQIQRYEQTLYSGASIERLQDVAEALKLTVRKTVDFHIPTGATPKLRSSGGSRRHRNTTSGGVTMANRNTGKIAASAAGKTLGSRSASKAARSAAASDLAQVANRKTTGTRAASAASKTLRAKGSSKAAKSAAASDLSQAAPKKKR